ncbi:hypothetical protein HDU96_006598 [Phlyctochytrium bullatum]|nr:hypothetical protein HDU96_006598 [Phlyctochytrium bullatum]
MLEFLYENRPGGCTADGLSSAARAGHVRVVELLVAKRLEVARSLLENAVLSNSVELLRYCRSMPQLERFWDPALVGYAAQHGRFESLRWLWEELGLGLTRLDFSPIIDVALYAMQEKGLPVPEQPLLVQLLEVAASYGSLEQVEAITGGYLKLVLRLVDRFTVNEITEAKVLTDALFEGHIEVARFLRLKGHTNLDEETTQEMLRFTDSLDIIDFVISHGYHTHMDLSEDFRNRAFTCFCNIDITERCYYDGGLTQSFVPGDLDFFGYDADFLAYDPDLIRFARAKRMLDLDRFDPIYHDSLICFQLFVSWNLVQCNTATAERAAVEGSYGIIRWLSRRHPAIFTTRVMTKAITSPTSTATLVVEFLLDNHLNCWDPRVHVKLVPGSKAVAHLLSRRGVRRVNTRR